MPSLSCQTIRPRSTDRHTQTHFSMCLATNLPPLHFGPPNNIFLVLSHTHKHTHTHNLSVCLLPLSPTRLQSPSPLWRLPSLPSSLPLSFIKSHCYIVKHWLDVKRRVFTIGGMGVGGMDGKKGSRNIREVDEKKRRKMYVCTHHAVSNVSAPFCLSVSFARWCSKAAASQRSFRTTPAAAAAASGLDRNRPTPGRRPSADSGRTVGGGPKSGVDTDSLPHFVCPPSLFSSQKKDFFFLFLIFLVWTWAA
jgi:hypothetical protein